MISIFLPLLSFSRLWTISEVYTLSSRPYCLDLYRSSIMFLSSLICSNYVKYWLLLHYPFSYICWNQNPMCWRRYSCSATIIRQQGLANTYLNLSHYSGSIITWHFTINYSCLSIGTSYSHCLEEVLVCNFEFYR